MKPVFDYKERKNGAENNIGRHAFIDITADIPDDPTELQTWANILRAEIINEFKIWEDAAAIGFARVIVKK